MEKKNLITGNSSAAAAAAEVAASAVDDVVPCPSPADSPAPPIIIPSALQSDNPHSEKEKPKPEEDTQSPSSSPFHLFSPERHEPQEDGKVPQEVPAMSVPGLEVAPFLGPAESELLSTTTPLSQESLSDFSRPPSSLFSRSTDLSGRSSNFSGESFLIVTDCHCGKIELDHMRGSNQGSVLKSEEWQRSTCSRCRTW